MRVDLKTINGISCRDEKVKTNKRGQVHSWHLERYDMIHDTTQNTAHDLKHDTTHMK